MPLTGDAKREYQRAYMRQARQVVTKSRKLLKETVGREVAGAALVSHAARQVSQVKLTEALDQAGWTVERHVSKRIQLTEFKRTVGVENGVAIEAPDGDVQCRAMDAMDRMLERAGTIPAASQPAGGSGGLHYHLHLGSLAVPRLIPAIDAVPPQYDEAELDATPQDR